MHRISWNMYKSAIQNYIPEEKGVIAGRLDEALDEVRESAIPLLKDIAKKHKVDYTHLVTHLYQGRKNPFSR